MSRNKGTKNNEKHDKLEEYFEKVKDERTTSNPQHDNNESESDSKCAQSDK